MTTKRKINRLYSTSDANMLEFANLIHQRYTNNLADFTAYDADLDVTVADDLMNEIQLAENFVSDDQLIDVQADTTRNMLLQMETCKNYFQRHIVYFVKKAFPNRPEILNEFGANDYARDSRSQARMIQFMKKAYVTAQKYVTELTAANFTIALMDELNDITVELQTLNMTQEDAKDSRRTATGQRIVLLNNVWMSVQQIRRAAKAVYFDDYNKLQLFLLPWAGGVPADNEIHGTVNEGETVNVPIPDITGASVVTLSNTGPVPLHFCGSEVAGVACVDGITVVPGDSQAVTLQTISPAGSNPTFLNVSHNVAPPGSPAGEFTVIPVS